MRIAKSSGIASASPVSPIASTLASDPPTRRPLPHEAIAQENGTVEVITLDDEEDTDDEDYSEKQQQRDEKQGHHQSAVSIAISSSLKTVKRMKHGIKNKIVGPNNDGTGATPTIDLIRSNNIRTMVLEKSEQIRKSRRRSRRSWGRPSSPQSIKEEDTSPIDDVTKHDVLVGVTRYVTPSSCERTIRFHMTPRNISLFFSQQQQQYVVVGFMIIREIIFSRNWLLNSMTFI